MGHVRSFNHPIKAQLFSAAAPRELRLLLDEASGPLGGDSNVVGFLCETIKHTFVVGLRFSGTSVPSDIGPTREEKGDDAAARVQVEVAELQTDIPTHNPRYWAKWIAWGESHTARVDHILLSDELARDSLRREHPVARNRPPSEYLEAILAVGVSRATRSDLLVTSNGMLLDDDSLVTTNVAVGDANFALVMTTLHLRTRGVFPIYTGTHALELSKDLFFRAASYAVIPAGHVLWATTLENERNGAPDRLTFLVHAVMTRVARSLQARDGVLAALFAGGRSGGVADDALFSFDTSLLFLSGAFDACAALVDEYLELKSTPMSIGWGREKWLKKVQVREPRIAAVLAPDSEATALIQIVGALRNTVHGEGVDLIQYRSTTDGDADLLRLPSRAGATFREAMRIVDPSGHVELHELVPGHLHVEPISTIRFLYPKFLELLNQLVRECARLALPDGHGIDLDAYPTTKATMANVIFSEPSALSIKAQLWV